MSVPAQKKIRRSIADETAAAAVAADAAVQAAIELNASPPVEGDYSERADRQQARCEFVRREAYRFHEEQSAICKKWYDRDDPDIVAAVYCNQSKPLPWLRALRAMAARREHFWTAAIPFKDLCACHYRQMLSHMRDKDYLLAPPGSSPYS